MAAKAQPLDPANIQIQSFPAGDGPQRLAFDGANIWVTNQYVHTVTKLRASDGANLGTFPAGNYPAWITFDGANIWVSNQTVSGTVTKLRASDGVVLGTFDVGGLFPEGIAYDGANIWVAATLGLRCAVTKLRASDGVVLGVYQVDHHGTGSSVSDVLFDGTSIWVVVYGEGVTKLDPSDGSQLGRVSIAFPKALAFDGTKIWVTSLGSVIAALADNGRVVGTVSVGDIPSGIAFDGRQIWVANSGDNSVSILSARDGDYLRTIRVEPGP